MTDENSDQNLGSTLADLEHQLDKAALEVSEIRTRYAMGVISAEDARDELKELPNQYDVIN